jgi:hypothetical protein
MKKQIFKVSVLLAFVLLQEGCMQKEISQEGEVVTWKLTPELIVKARLGERRKHIPDTHCFRCESEFYRPEYERYIGQFPIDYQPKKFDKLDETEAKAMPVTLMDNGIEFNLMLNGSTVQATDKSIYGEKGLDHIDQVKVMVFNQPSKYNTAQSFDVFEKSGEGIYNKQASLEYGLQCYVFSKTNGLNCFGQSDNSKVSGISFKFMDEHWIFGEAREPIYGGIKVQWRIDSRNLKQWKQVDAAIWRLLEAWNVSPFNKISKQQ